MESFQSRVALLRKSVDTDQFTRFTYNCLHTTCTLLTKQLFARFLFVSIPRILADGKYLQGFSSLCAPIYTCQPSHLQHALSPSSLRPTSHKAIAHKIYTSDSYSSKSLWNQEIEIWVSEWNYFWLWMLRKLSKRESNNIVDNLR